MDQEQDRKSLSATVVEYDWTQHYTMLKKYALFLTQHKDRAQDLLQDTYVKILTYAPNFDGRYPHAWCITIMRNIHHSNRRQEISRWKLIQRNSHLVNDHIEYPSQEHALELKQVLELIPQLMSAEQEQVVLARAMGYHVKELSSLLNIEAGTIKSRQARGVQRLPK